MVMLLISEVAANVENFFVNQNQEVIWLLVFVAPVRQ